MRKITAVKGERHKNEGLREAINESDKLNGSLTYEWDQPSPPSGLNSPLQGGGRGGA